MSKAGLAHCQDQITSLYELQICIPLKPFRQKRLLPNASASLSSAAYRFMKSVPALTGAESAMHTMPHTSRHMTTLTALMRSA